MNVAVAGIGVIDLTASGPVRRAGGIVGPACVRAVEVASGSAAAGS